MLRTGYRIRGCITQPCHDDKVIRGTNDTVLVTRIWQPTPTRVLASRLACDPHTFVHQLCASGQAPTNRAPPPARPGAPVAAPPRGGRTGDTPLPPPHLLKAFTLCSALPACVRPTMEDHVQRVLAGKRLLPPPPPPPPPSLARPSPYTPPPLTRPSLDAPHHATMMAVSEAPAIRQWGHGGGWGGGVLPRSSMCAGPQRWRGVF